jgi:hypothetical protein
MHLQKGCCLGPMHLVASTTSTAITAVSISRPGLRSCKAKHEQRDQVRVPKMTAHQLQEIVNRF